MTPLRKPPAATRPDDTSSRVALAVSRWEGTGRPVLLLHELGTSRRDFDRLAPALAGRTLVSYDQRGHGDSAAAPTLELDALLEDIDQVRARHRLEDPIDLVGCGWSAHLALRYALADPTVARLVLVDGALSPLHARVAHAQIARLVTPLGEPPVPERVAVADPIERQIAEARRARYQDDGRPRIAPAQIAQLLEQVWDQAVEREITALARPVLVIASGVDERSPSERLEEIDRAHSHAVHYLRRIAHVQVRSNGLPRREVLLRYPQEIARPLSEFLDRV